MLIEGAFSTVFDGFANEGFGGLLVFQGQCNKIIDLRLRLRMILV